MAAQGVAIGGAVIGGILGSIVGAPQLGVALGGMAGGIVGSLLFQPKPQVPDIVISGSAYGTFIPIVYGTARIPGQLVWTSGIQAVTEAAVGGGKGLAAGSQVVAYHMTFAMLLCEGPIARVLKIWADGKLIVDATASFFEFTTHKFNIRTYLGDETQLPDPEYAAWVALNVPVANQSTMALRGRAYVLFDQMDLIDFGNRLPNLTFLVATSATDSVPVSQVAPLPTDPSDVTDVVAIAVDFIRSVGYWLSSDSTIRIFDLQTSKVTRSVLASSMVPLGDPVPSFTGIACGQGGGVYAFNNSLVYKLDPDSLFRLFTFGDGGPGWDETGFNGINELLVVSLIAPTETLDVIIVGGLFAEIGILQGNNLTYVYGDTSSPDYVPFFNEGLTGRVRLVQGAQTTTETDVWILNFSVFADGLYIYKLTLDAGIGPSGPSFSDGLTITLAGTLTMADFGQTPGAFNLGSFSYDVSSDCLIINVLNSTMKWSPESGPVWLNESMAPAGTQPQYTFTDYGTFATSFSVADSTLGEVVGPGDPNPPGPTLYSLTNIGAYNSLNNSMVFLNFVDGNLYIAYLYRGAANLVSLASIITDICGRVGIGPSQLDVSLVTTEVLGYVISHNMSAAAALGQLCQTFQIDAVESDYLLKFIPKGSLPPVATIPQIDLGSVDTANQAKYWESVRAQEPELPLQINVKFQDPALDYQPNVESSKRNALPVPTVFSKRISSLDLPVIMGTAQARQLADSWLFQIWAKRITYESMLGWKYLWTDPTDTALVQMDNGDSYTVQMTKEEVGADFQMHCNFAAEESTVYVSPAPAAYLSYVPQTIVVSNFGQLFLLNVPLLQDADDTGGVSSRVYFAAGVFAGGWNAGTLLESLDGGATYNSYAYVPIGANWGGVQTPLGDTFQYNCTDRINKLTISMSGSSTPPSTITYLQMMNGGNAALVGAEVIQFQTVAVNDDGTLTLSNLLRGRRGTEWATGSHGPGETILLLTTGTVDNSTIGLTEIGVTRYWKLLPAGRSQDQAPTVANAFKGYDLFPYAPCQFVRTASGSDLIVSWFRRTRIGGQWRDGTGDVPLAEEAEAYEIYVLANAGAITSFDPTNSATYVRKFSPTSAGVTYTAAEMTADGFTPATDTLYLAAYQISAAIGRGFQAYAALPPP